MALRILQLLLLMFFVVLTLAAKVKPHDLHSTPNLTQTAYIENTLLHFSYELEERWLSFEKNPCNDFYGFVCEKQANDNKLLNVSRLAAVERFRGFLQANNATTYVRPLSKSELKARNFYESCRQARSLDDLKGTLMYRTSGGWPAVENTSAPIFKRKNATWMHVLIAFHDVGAQPYLFKHRVDMKSNRRTVMLTLSEKQRYTMRKYEQLTNEVLEEYQVEPARARLISLETLQFERVRRLTHKDNNTLEPHEWNYTDFKSMAFQSVGTLDWDNYFKKLLGKPLKPNDTIFVRDMGEMQNIFNLLHNTSMTRLLNWIWIDYLMDKNTSNCLALTEKYFKPVYQYVVQRTAVNKLELANMYVELGRIYEQLLAKTVWIDEMSQQNSKQFLGRMMQLTQNGHEALDAEYAALTLGRKNFYRNLEKVQRFMFEQKWRPVSFQTIAHQNADDFMNTFLLVNHLINDRNLTAPLSYILVAQRFAENMIASGSTSRTVGAWRSMDSENAFHTFEQCISNMTKASEARPNANTLLLKSLSMEMGLMALENWMQKHNVLRQRFDNLLTAGRWQLSLRKLYFIGALLTDCQMDKDTVNIYLKNTQHFSKTFNCSTLSAPSTTKLCRVSNSSLVY